MQLYGWDTVFALSLDQVNAQLALHQNLIITEFRFSGNDAPAYTATGRFLPWKIVAGGSGKLLHLEVPIQAGTFELNHGQEVSNLAGISIVLEISLQLLPSAVQPDEHHLSFDFKRAASRNVSGDLGLVTPVTLLDPRQQLKPITRAILPMLMAEYLIQKASLISYVFAKVNLVSPGAAGWLAPVQADYGYLSLEGSAGGYLAILAVTDHRDISGYPRTVDPRIISGNANAGFFISQDLFLKNVIMPQLPSTFGHGTSSGTFRYDMGDHAIHNTTSFEITSTKVGAITYHAICQSMRMTTYSDLVTTHIDGSCDMGMDIHMSYELDMQNQLQFDAGTQSFHFAKDAHPHSSHDVKIPWYDWFLGPIPDAIMAAVVPAIADSIANNLQSESNSLSIAAQPPQSVHWTGMDNFHVITAGLSDCFFMAGKM